MNRSNIIPQFHALNMTMIKNWHLNTWKTQTGCIKGYRVSEWVCVLVCVNYCGQECHNLFVVEPVMPVTQCTQNKKYTNEVYEKWSMEECCIWVWSRSMPFGPSNPHQHGWESIKMFTRVFLLIHNRRFQFDFFRVYAETKELRT